jgi:hypothetical protein
MQIEGMMGGIGWYGLDYRLVGFQLQKTRSYGRGVVGIRLEDAFSIFLHACGVKWGWGTHARRQPGFIVAEVVGSSKALLMLRRLTYYPGFVISAMEQAFVLVQIPKPRLVLGTRTRNGM